MRTKTCTRKLFHYTFRKYKNIKIDTVPGIQEFDNFPENSSGNPGLTLVIGILVIEIIHTFLYNKSISLNQPSLPYEVTNRARIF